MDLLLSRNVEAPVSWTGERLLLASCVVTALEDECAHMRVKVLDKGNETWDVWFGMKFFFEPKHLSI